MTLYAPPNGWPAPWPQCMELAVNLPASEWTLVGGLMVQLHTMAAGLAVARPTMDVDIVLNIEAGSTLLKIRTQLQILGYEFSASIDEMASAHRFLRGSEQIDVMFPDHADPRTVKGIGNRKPVLLPAGTQALQRRVLCTVITGDRGEVELSLPSLLAAWILKAAAHREDSRDTERHLDDAVVLTACIRDPYLERDAFKGSDRGRLQYLERQLHDSRHRSWLMLGAEERMCGQGNLRILAADVNLPPKRRKPR